MAQWSLLPMDLLNIIEEHLDLYVDKVRIRCVCSSWRSHLPKLHNHSICRLPWLLVPYNLESGTCGFFDPLEKMVYKLDLPEAGEKVFKGSTQGWVVVVEKSSAIYLVNPLTRARVNLPPRSRFPDVRKYRADKHDNEYFLRESRNWHEYYPMDATQVRNYLVQKVVLSSSPTCSDYVAAAIYGELGRLAYCKRGDKKWSVLHEELHPFADVIFHEGKLYAVKYNGRLVACDIGSCPKPRLTEIAPGPPRILTGQIYLVGSSSGIIMVERDTLCDYLNEHDEEEIGDVINEQDQKFIHETVGFNIFKLDTSGRKWCRVESLGDDVLFLGMNSSTAFSSHDFPCCNGNYIYCTDDQLDYDIKGSGRLFDQGVFSLDGNKFEHLPPYVGDSRVVWPAPIWVMPSPF